MQNNQLPTNSHVELEDNSNTLCLFPENFTVFHDLEHKNQKVNCKPTSMKPRKQSATLSIVLPLFLLFQTLMVFRRNCRLKVDLDINNQLSIIIVSLGDIICSSLGSPSYVKGI